jgi:NAD(P)-dependent dehydrogenase (short-subunit alcohol dehydrogenase family)
MDLKHLFSLEGRVALVTGGSRGIGAMAAEGLLAAGATVVVSGRRAADVAAAAQTLSAHGRCHGIPADLATPEGIALLIQGLRERTERLDILVNNAGTAWGAALDAFPRHGFDKVLALNVATPFDVVRGLLPLLRAAASAASPARIINVASVDGLRPPTAETYSYSASKAALLMLTRHLAARLVGERITVNAIAPGLFATRMTAYMFDPAHPRAGDRPAIPMSRPGRTEDIAGAVVYLASLAGSYLTGAVIPVSGGIATIA